MPHTAILKKKIIISSLVLTLSLISSAVASETKGDRPIETALEQKNIGSYYWQRGQISKAIAAWKKEAEVYQNHQLTEQSIETALRIAQGYISLGQFDSAIFNLEKILLVAEEPTQKARIWEQLGNAYTRSGELEVAIAYYQKSLDHRQSLSTLNNMVRLREKQALRSQLKANSSREGQPTQQYLAEVAKARELSLQYLEKAIELSLKEDSASSVRTSIERAKRFGIEKEQQDRVTKLLKKLPDSRTKAFLAINWGKLDTSQTDYWLSESLRVAQSISDRRAESYAWLELGLRAEKQGKNVQAKNYAQEAIALARQTSTSDSLYQALWLAARIERKNGQKAAARENYRSAIAALGTYFRESRFIGVEKRLDFGTKIEPLYREALTLLLEPDNPTESMLRESLDIFEQLRLAQLQQFFGDNCFQIEETGDSTEILASKKALLLTSIILEDETHFFLQLSDGTIRHARNDLGQKEVEELVTEFYAEISSGLSWQIRPLGQKLYDLVLLPFSEELKKTSPSTLIFIHDGKLRNIPMAALYDGQKFVAQKWASISSIGLNFVYPDQQNLAVNDDEPLMAAFGLGVGVREWSPLGKVAQEISTVISFFGGRQFLDSDFTTGNFAEELRQENYRKVHLATHGYFGGVAENSFLLAYDRPLFALDLEKSLTPEIELLVLSACETAISSDRSALGLAGLALRNGVDSVLGSYWLVEDSEQLELMSDFYSRISQQRSRSSDWAMAIALQQIQIEQIELEENPAKWAALSLSENF